MSDALMSFTGDTLTSVDELDVAVLKTVTAVQYWYSIVLTWNPKCGNPAMFGKSK